MPELVARHQIILTTKHGRLRTGCITIQPHTATATLPLARRLRPWFLCSFFTSCTLAVFLTAISTASAANVYIRSQATGANNGTDWINAYTSIPSPMIRGNTYYLAAGTYGSYTFSVPISGSTLITLKKATAADHGTHTGWSSTYGDGLATFSSASITVNTGYFVIDGATGGGPGSWKIGHGIVFTSPAGTSIEYINVASGVSHLVVRRVHFTQAGNTETTTARANGIYNNNILNNSLFEYNYFDNLGGLPFFLRNGSGNIFQYNYLGNICGMSVADPNQHCEGIVIWGMTDVHFRWNYVSKSPSSGGFVKNSFLTADAIRIYGNVIANGFPINCNHGSCTKWIIFNNTFHTGSSGPVGGDGTMSGSYFYNNIMFNFSFMAPMWGIHDYNWLSRSSGLRCRMGAATHENICSGCSGGCDSLTMTTDPFVNASGSTPEDFRLTKAIREHDGDNVCQLDGCTGENKYNIDAFGLIRGADGVWDRGAYEYSSRRRPSPSTRGPIRH